jgi:hypothetical protein
MVSWFRVEAPRGRSLADARERHLFFGPAPPHTAAGRGGCRAYLDPETAERWSPIKIPREEGDPDRMATIP